MSEIIKEGETLTDIALESSKWRHRRRMAYASIIGILTIAVLSLVRSSYIPDERLTAASDVLGWVLIALAGIVVAYFGNNAMEASMKKGK